MNAARIEIIDPAARDELIDVDMSPVDSSAMQALAVLQVSVARFRRSSSAPSRRDISSATAKRLAPRSVRKAAVSTPAAAPPAPETATDHGLTNLWRGDFRNFPDTHRNKTRGEVLGLGAATRANAVAVMCDKCTELDRKIGHLRRMMAQIADAQTLAAATALIDEIEARKTALHSAGSDETPDQ